MAVVQTIDGDVIVNGNLAMGSVTLPDSNIIDAMVSGSADIGAAKVRHQHAVMYTVNTGTDVVTATRVIHIAKGDGVIAAVEVVCETAPTGGDKDFDVNIHKGNAGGAYATILSGDITMNSSSVARTIQTGTLSTTTYLDGDQFKIIITTGGSTGTQGKDVCVILWLQEKPS